MSEADSLPGILITGATGFIGSRLTALALKRGYPVRTYSRADWPGSPFVPVSRRHFGTLPWEIPDDMFEGVEAVIHCAATTDEAEAVAHAVNVMGTMNLARRAAAVGVRTFVFLTSQSARPDAFSMYGKTKYEAEQALLRLEGIDVIILRPGLVCGPGSRGVYGRLRQSIRSAPVYPLVAGLDPPVQPIHVDDLCEAVFRCLRQPDRLAGTVLNLGDPEGIPFSGFVQRVAVAELGRRVRTVRIPLGLIERAVVVSKRLGISLPVTQSNLQGMRATAKMETASHMARIGLHLREAWEVVNPSGPLGQDEEAGPGWRPLRLLLVGAGRIGQIHAAAVAQHPGLWLAGVVDASPAALSRIRGLGISAPQYRSLETALAEVRPDAAIIATPPSSHLAMARACLGRGLHVFVEKPLALTEEELAAYGRLAETRPNLVIQVGYLLPQAPHIVAWVKRLKAGRLGRVTGFLGFTLLSMIHRPGIRQWEVDPRTSGGGVMMNSGCHVISLIHSAFGSPSRVSARMRRIYSSAVEDAVVVRYDYPDFSGGHLATWSILGYPRAENRLLIATDRGYLHLTGTLGAFLGHDGAVEIVHHLDFPSVGDVLSDVVGGGLPAELEDFRRAIVERASPRVGLAEANAIERIVHAIYRSADTGSSGNGEVEGAAASAKGRGVFPSPTRVSGDGSSEGGSPDLVLDLRDLPSAAVARLFGDAGSAGRWDQFLVFPGAVGRVPDSVRRSGRLRVTAPDFYGMTRLIAAGGMTAALGALGLRGAVAAAREVLPGVLVERKLTFWAGIRGLLAASLSALPREFRGAVFLHGAVTDLALAMDRVDVLRGLLEMIRRRAPGVTVGFHTGAARKAASALPGLIDVVDAVSVLSSPGATGVADAIRATHQMGRPLVLSAEVGIAPAVVHRAAANAPTLWAHGATAVVIGVHAEPTAESLVRQGAEEEWQRVFPGIAFPEEAL